MTGEYQPLSQDCQIQRTVFGERFLRALYKLTQAVKVYQDNNQVLIECAEEFVGALTQWWEDEDHVTIQISRGRFFLQEEKLLFRRKNLNIMKEMLSYFDQRKLRGLRFKSSLKDSPFDQVLRFGRLLNRAEIEEDPVVWLIKKLKAGAFQWVEIVDIPDEVSQERDPERKEMARRTYANALTSVKEISQKITSQSGAGVRKLKRIAQNMVDLLSEDESVLLGLSTIRDYDDYTYTHSVNVAILSMCLGKRIGLSRVSMSMLGICGLVHDIGKVDIPLGILNKPGKLAAEELEEIKKHPLRSVSKIIKLRATRDLKAKILLPPFEHHMKYDLSGYPRIHRKRSISLFGRILAIADVFDALTSPRIYRPKTYSPDLALGLMLEGTGKDFDPILLKVFINMLGVYPVGTLLLLDTGEKGLVINFLEGSDIARPLIVLLLPDGQKGFKKGKLANLAGRNPKTGSYLRNIVRTLHPSSYGIQPADFIL